MSKNALSLANRAGHILLENGAEISRVESTMQRIADHYGEDDGNFFVLSNGIIATGDDYAKAEFIPLKGARLDKVAAVNQASRDVAQLNLSLEQLEGRLDDISRMPPKPAWEQILGSAVGAGFFAMIFGGSLADSAVAFIAGLVLHFFVYFVSGPYLSRLLGNISGGLIAASVCIAAYHLGFGDHLGNMIIGAIIPLVPGVPFTNGIRDIAGEDYLAGTTRLLDAFMMFLGIAAGVALAFVLDGAIFGGLIQLQAMKTDPVTAHPLWQLAAAFFGTAAFAILFGVPRKHYLDCGFAGAAGWMTYIVLTRAAGFTPVEATFFGSMAVLLCSRFLAIWRRCPVTVFLVCGIFPLVPGGGLFWTSYYLIAGQTNAALSSGFLAVKICVAIALGIIVVEEAAKFFPSHHK
ncbi:MAG: threonine/serine exporter family protein [Bacteroidales bacterium]|nr:threonine/serine exporter family protein [Bacteroidales bacterium]MBQ9888954.1 threonine/serine exporter family protein [Bacteroidales bacterium]